MPVRRWPTWDPIELDDADGAGGPMRTQTTSSSGFVRNGRPGTAS